MARDLAVHHHTIHVPEEGKGRGGDMFFVQMNVKGLFI